VRLRARRPRTVNKVPGGWDVEFSCIIRSGLFPHMGPPEVHVTDWSVTIRGSELRYVATAAWSPLMAPSTSEPLPR
jgi:hypothetical protein